MYRKERTEKIMQILRENGYVNVKYLCTELGYSKATINRDLNYLENLELITRSYGGVELVERQSIPLAFRYHKMKNEKKRICKAAAALVNDGDTIFIDASSTTEYMAPYLARKKAVTVITNNISIVSYLSEFTNIRTICLGGVIAEPPAMLCGDLCIKNTMEYKADKMFFATESINEEGEIGGSGVYSLHLSVMAKNSSQVIYMADHEKINLRSASVVMTLDDVDIVVTDYSFDEKIKARFKNVEFIEV